MRNESGGVGHIGPSGSMLEDVGVDVEGGEWRNRGH